MKTTRIIALLLAVCMCFSAFILASCEEEEYVRPEGGTNNNDDPRFKSADYEGEDFTFMTLTSRTSTSEYYCGQWIYAEDLTGTATNDAVYKRNLAAKEKYNVNITEKNGGEGAEDLNQYYMANDYSFDVIYSWASRLGPVITDGLFYDFRELDADGYIDLEAAYWSPETLDDLTIAGRTFLAINDITMSKLSWTGCMFYNPQIIEDYGLEDPQDLVEANEWTLDKYLEMVMAIHDDTDGDGTTFTQEDRYGMIDQGAIGALLGGCGVRYTNKDADGYYTLAIGETKVIDLITKIRDVLNDRSHVFDHTTITTSGADMTGYDEWEFVRSYFAKGHSLFASGTPEITREFKDMESGYGVVPLPKYDSNQTSYCGGIDTNAGIFAVPNTCRNDGVSTASFDRTGTVLEYLAYKSAQEGSVVSAYYDTTIKGQRQTIERNKDMLDIIKTTGYYEWSTIVKVGGDGKTIGDTLNNMCNTRGIASAYKQAQQRLTTALDDTYAEFLNLQ